MKRTTEQIRKEVEAIIDSKFYHGDEEKTCEDLRYRLWLSEKDFELLRAGEYEPVEAQRRNWCRELDIYKTHEYEPGKYKQYFDIDFLEEEI